MKWQSVSAFRGVPLAGDGKQRHLRLRVGSVRHPVFSQLRETPGCSSPIPKKDGLAKNCRPPDLGENGAAMAEGILALLLLIVFQYLITWMSVRSSTFEKFIKSEPTLLVHDGRYLDAAMRKQRVTHVEIGAVLRANGKLDVSEVQSVVLETDGSMTMVPKAGK